MQSSKQEPTLYDLIKNGINSNDNDGRSPLMIALDNKQFDRANILISLGADLFCKDKKGRIPLDVIRNNGNTKLIISTIQSGISADLLLSPSRITPDFLHQHPELYKIISDKQIDISSLPKATILALQTTSDDAISKLQDFFQNGGDVNTKDINGNTLLMHTCSNNNSQNTLRYLIEQVADINASNNKGETALICASKNNCKDNIKLLLENNAKTDIQDKDGNTALMHAVYNDCYDAVKLLNNYGADATTTNNKGENILIAAVNNNSINSFNYILEELTENNQTKEQHNITDEKNSIEQNSEQHLQPIGKQINIDHQDNDGNSALMHAISKGNIPFARKLIEHNANLTLTNAANEDLLIIAAKQEKKEIMDFVIQNCVDFNEDNDNIPNAKLPTTKHISSPKSQSSSKKITITSKNVSYILEYAQKSNNQTLLNTVNRLTPSSHLSTSTSPTDEQNKTPHQNVAQLNDIRINNLRKRILSRSY